MRIKQRCADKTPILVSVLISGPQKVVAKELLQLNMLYNLGSPVWHSVMTWKGRMGGGREAQKAGDSHGYTAETNTIL